jgi:hypothetical protein
LLLFGRPMLTAVALGDGGSIFDKLPRAWWADLSPPFVYSCYLFMFLWTRWRLNIEGNWKICLTVDEYV